MAPHVSGSEPLFFFLRYLGLSGGQAGNCQDQARQQRRHGFLLRDEEKPADRDREALIQEVRSHCAQARSFQRNEDQVGRPIARPIVAPSHRQLQVVRYRSAPIAEPRQSIGRAKGENAQQMYSHTSSARPSARNHPLFGESVAASVTDIGSGVEVRAVTDAGLPSHGPKRALARPGVRSSVGGTSRGGHS